MAINKKDIDQEAVEQAIAYSLEQFYNSLLEKIDTINIDSIMKRKNLYLYRAKSIQSAAEIVEGVLSATVSSSEETIFGNCFFEPLAIAASGGSKALAEGVDIMVDDRENNTIYAIAVKSGPSVFNADSKKRQEQNFNAARKLAQQAKAIYEPIIGYSYGKKRSTGKGCPTIYKELARQDFWLSLQAIRISISKSLHTWATNRNSIWKSIVKVITRRATDSSNSLQINSAMMTAA